LAVSADPLVLGSVNALTKHATFPELTAVGPMVPLSYNMWSRNMI